MPESGPVLKRQKLFAERLESGPWLSAGEMYRGTVAEDVFRSAANDESEADHPYCIYVHIPFCLSRCSYCALYTIEVKDGREEIFDAFLARFVRSLDVHPQRNRLPPPVTVHFGGGTPLSLGIPRFLRLREAVRDAFGDAPSCEWAVESTTSALDESASGALYAAGFRRLHLGVQTLEDKVRRRIGRREPGKAVLDKIRRLISMGFNVSADLILGFDNFSGSMLERDLKKLFASGIRMFSICELRVLTRKPADAPARLAESERNRALWSRVWDFMREHGLRPIHGGQFGTSDRDNLFYTHPARREHCVALGPYAHGSARNLMYGNLLLPEYLEAAREGRPGVDYAVVYPETFQRLRDLESDLLAHRIRRDTVDRAIEVWGQWLGALWEAWLLHGLVVPVDDTDFVLSRDGSWFVGNMIRQAREQSESR
jgi:coproporphyrinogen III oxidase-like Fe-S oxidoreductase